LTIGCLSCMPQNSSVPEFPISGHRTPG
jgi:hypothetical protein